MFLTEQHLENNFLGPKKGQVRPCLVTEEDRQFLWENLEYIDTIGSDHAPHTLEEKENHRYLRTKKNALIRYDQFAQNTSYLLIFTASNIVQSHMLFQE